MIKFSTKSIKTKSSREEIKKILNNIPMPINLFYGVSSIVRQVPNNVLIWKRSSDGENCTALHQRYLLTVNLEQTCHFKIDDTLYRLSSGDGILVYPYQTHSFTYSDNIKNDKKLRLVITFEIQSDEDLVLLKNVPFKVPARAWTVIKEMLSSYKRPKDSPDPASSDTGCRLALLLNILAGDKKAIFSPPITFPNEALKKIMGFIHENYQKNIKIADIARHVNISESHVRKIFREGTSGLSLGDFIRNIKLYHSLKYLAYTNMNIADIAEKCGFNSVTAYGRAYKKWTRRTPMEHRRMYYKI